MKLNMTADGYKHGAEYSRKPLISFLEAADEFGVTPAVLRGQFHRDDAPKPVLVHRRKTTTSWYDPAEIRAWWRLCDPLRGIDR